MIKKSIPLSLAEVADLAGDSEKEKKMKKFVKDFSGPVIKKAREMKEELKNLNLIKLNDEHIVKIVDFMPEDASDLNKVISDVSLDQDEINKILEVVKKY